MNYYQQGDVLICQVDELPKKLRAKKTNVVVSGQNNHELSGGSFVNYGSHIKVTKQATIKHPQHGQIKIPKGVYEIKIVKEYDHFLEESREVRD